MRVLAYTSPARGHLYPAVAMLRALAERGHATHVRALSEELGELAKVGVDASAIDPAIERIQIVDWQERSQQGAVVSVLRTFAERAAHEAPDLARAIDWYDPDVILVDVNSWGAATLAEASGRPWAIFSPYLLPLRSRDAPPFGPGLRPLGGPVGAVRDAVVHRIAERIVAGVAMPPLNALRAEHGLPPFDRFEDLLRLAPLVLSLTAEGFEYPHSDWPASVRLVGPMNWSPTHPQQPAPTSGVRLTPRRLSSRRLARAVHTAIEHRAGAQRVSRAFASAGGPKAAADAIEALAGRGGGDFVGDKIRP